MQPGSPVPSEEKVSKLYQQAGVDIEAADQLVTWLQTQQDPRPAASGLGETVAGIGGFAALFRPRFHGMAEPLLVSTTDGVGTKLLLALSCDHLEDIGIDLVAMCANDLFTVGAQPLFFLDYFATGQLDQRQFQTVLAGIRKGLSQCHTPLLGGETAEMPGLYQKGHIDLAGFMLGVVDRPALLGPPRVQAGDVLVGLGSSGFHSNGFSLIRSWLQQAPEQLKDEPLISSLLRPTLIYSSVPALAAAFPDTLHALAHITGGGIPGNLARIMPPQLCGHIEGQHIPTPEWMEAFLQRHQASRKDTAGIFNLGVGMIACLEPTGADAFIRAAGSHGLQAFVLGAVKARATTEEPVIIHF